MDQTILIQSIIDEFDLTGNTFIENVLPVWFSMYADKGDINLQYLYTKKRVLAYLIFRASKKIDVIIGGDSFKKSQTASALNNLLNAINDEIKQQDPNAEVPVLTSISPYSELPNAMDNYLDNIVDNCWDGKY